MDAISKATNPTSLLSEGGDLNRESLLMNPVSTQTYLTTNLFNASSFATQFMLRYLSNSGLGKSKYKNSTLPFGVTRKFRKVSNEKVSAFEDLKLIKGKSWSKFHSKVNLPK